MRLVEYDERDSVIPVPSQQNNGAYSIGWSHHSIGPANIRTDFPVLPNQVPFQTSTFLPSAPPPPPNGFGNSGAFDPGRGRQAQSLPEGGIGTFETGSRPPAFAPYSASVNELSDFSNPPTVPGIMFFCALSPDFLFQGSYFHSRNWREPLTTSIPDTLSTRVALGMCMRLLSILEDSWGDVLPAS